MVLFSAAEIPEAADGTARAYFEAASGDVYLSVGENLGIVGVGERVNGDVVPSPFDVQAANMMTPLGELLPEGLFPRDPPREVAWLILSKGVFNIGNLLPSEPRVDSLAEFDALYPNLVSFAQVGGSGTQTERFGLIAGAAVRNRRRRC